MPQKLRKINKCIALNNCFVALLLYDFARQTRHSILWAVFMVSEISIMSANSLRDVRSRRVIAFQIKITVRLYGQAGWLSRWD